MAGCEICGRELTRGKRGPAPRFCGQTCRKRASRRSPFPSVMTDRDRWVRRARVWRDGRWHAGAPLTASGAAASSTDSSTWSTFKVASASSAGVGMGFMLGGGIGCYDLDEVSDAAARRFLATVKEPIIFAERSQSGRGVHAFVEAPESRGWRRSILGVSVERYTRERYIAVTGDIFTL